MAKRQPFTEDELDEARATYPSPQTCTRCQKVGDIDEVFGWRRMHPEDATIRPQPQCYDCRALSWKRDKGTVDKPPEAKTYRVNEVFYSLQGEGVRAGSPNVFVRFSGCNLKCRQETHGFDCDTEFQSGRSLSLEALCDEVQSVAGECRWVVLTGGEPLLQVDEALVNALRDLDFDIAIETNGTILPSDEVIGRLSWICVSPKAAEHVLVDFPLICELKYVRDIGQPIPRPKLEADYYLISPACGPEHVSRETLDYCIALVKENPKWRLSVQQHKGWRVR